MVIQTPSLYQRHWKCPDCYLIRHRLAVFTAQYSINTVKHIGENDFKWNKYFCVALYEKCKTEYLLNLGAEIKIEQANHKLIGTSCSRPAWFRLSNLVTQKYLVQNTTGVISWATLSLVLFTQKHEADRKYF